MMLDQSVYIPAKFKKRLFAFVIDYLIVSCIGIVIFFALMLIFFLLNGINPLVDYAAGELDYLNPIFGKYSNILLAYIMPILLSPYFVFLESSKWQGTIGKRIFNLQVVGDIQSRIPFSQAILRTFFKILFGLLPPSGLITFGCLRIVSPFGCLINLIMSLTSSKKQTLYDMISKTQVVERRGTNPMTQSVVIKDIHGNNKISVSNTMNVDQSNKIEIQIDQAFFDQLASLKKSLEGKKKSQVKQKSLELINVIEREAKSSTSSQLLLKLKGFGKNTINWLYRFAVDIGAHLVAGLLLKLLESG